MDFLKCNFYFETEGVIHMMYATYVTTYVSQNQIRNFKNTFLKINVQFFTKYTFYNLKLYKGANHNGGL